MLARNFSLEEQKVRQLIDNVATKSVELISQFNIDPGQLKPFSETPKDANNELSRLNMSYEMLLIAHKDATQRAERLALDLKAANEKLRDAAFRDGLTGLFNRRYFQEALSAELGMRRTPSRAVWPDHPGHRRFQGCERQVRPSDRRCGSEHGARRLHQSRRSDVVVRYGGDEFAIILPETNLNGAAVKGEAVRRELESIEIKAGAFPGSRHDQRWHLRLRSAKPLSKERLVVAADRALYRSKREGRNRVTGSRVPVPASPRDRV